MPEVGAREIEELVTPSVEHGFEHVEGEAAGHFGGDRRRDRQLGACHDRIGQRRSVMRERGGDAAVDPSGVSILMPVIPTTSAIAAKLVPVGRNPIDLLLDLNEGQPSRRFELTALAARRRRWFSVTVRQ